MEFTYGVCNSPKPTNLFGGNASCSLQLEPTYLLRIKVSEGEPLAEFGFAQPTHRLVRGTPKLKPDSFINELSEFEP